MKKAPLLFLLMASLHGYAHLQYIHFEKIDPAGKYNKEINFISNNSQYYENWSPDWNFPVKKDSIVQELTRCYKVFAQVQAQSDNVEVDLLLGEIANYLYNMDIREYYDKAETFYQKAIHLDEKDYRSYWFLACHYATSTVQDKSVIFYEKARQLAPSDVPGSFWAEYGYAMLLANMISHCNMALDNARKLSDNGNYVTTLESLLKLRWLSIDVDSSYESKEIWEAAEQGKQIGFTSRPLGLKFRIDTSWGVEFSNYNNHSAPVILAPGKETSRKGRQISYSIAILIKTAATGETLDSYIAKFTKGQGTLMQESMSTPYKNAVCYSMRNPKMYPEIGGGHFHIVGIEREAPAYPGLVLEEPQNLPSSGEKERPNFYRPSQERTRFSGKIFYVLLLDTCEDIHDASYAVFRKLIQEQLVIE
jgi:tetratricopeptide (TPR) repeat protein